MIQPCFASTWMRRWKINFRNDVHFASKGFMDAVEVTDFPIRDHKVILVLRRRRWIDTRTGKFLATIKN